MFRAIGVVIILIALSKFFTSSLEAVNRAMTATFNTVEQAALVAESHLQAER